MTIISITFFICILFTSITYSYFLLLKYNQSPLNIKTFDGSNSPYHPAVIYFEQSWNGYKYWMAETPYSPDCKPYRDRNECPSLHVSNDGINWTEITQNPIDNLDTKGISELDYFSDPHLVFVNNHLECWYRLTKRYGEESNRSDVYLLRKTSKNGVDWSKREVLARLKHDIDNGLGCMVVSPAIIFEKGEYQMWYVDSELNKRNIAFSTSIDGYEWNNKIICELQGKEISPWHIDIKFINKRYLLTCYDFECITMYESYDKINFKYITTILSPSVPGSYYGNSLYRASLIHDGKYKLYFSSDDIFNTYIGVMEGEEITSMQVKDINSSKHRNFIEFTCYKMKIDYRRYCFICKNLFKRLSE